MIDVSEGENVIVCVGTISCDVFWRGDVIEKPAEKDFSAHRVLGVLVVVFVPLGIWSVWNMVGS